MAFSSTVIAAALEHPCVVVDAQVGLQRYRHATLFTPNLPKAEQAVGYAIDSDTRLLQAGADLLAQTEAKAILITRGEAGMSLFEHGGGHQHIPAFNKTDVFDITGAGEKVVSTLTLALVAGASLWDAAVLGNLTASIVVRQFGTATTTPEELAQALERLLEDEA